MDSITLLKKIEGFFKGKKSHEELEEIINFFSDSYQDANFTISAETEGGNEGKFIENFVQRILELRKLSEKEPLGKNIDWILLYLLAGFLEEKIKNIDPKLLLSLFQEMMNWLKVYFD